MLYFVTKYEVISTRMFCLLTAVTVDMICQINNVFESEANTYFIFIVLQNIIDWNFSKTTRYILSVRMADALFSGEYNYVELMYFKCIFIICYNLNVTSYKA